MGFYLKNINESNQTPFDTIRVLIRQIHQDVYQERTTYRLCHAKLISTYD